MPGHGLRHARDASLQAAEPGHHAPWWTTRSGTSGGPAIVLPASASSGPGNYFSILSGSTIELENQATGMCLDARGGPARGTPIVQWPCNAISNEHWSWPHGFPDGFWPLVSQVAGSNSFCLDQPGAAAFTAGLAMQLYTCNGTVAQAWGIVT